MYFYWNSGVLVYGVSCFILFLILKVLCVHYRMFSIATLSESDTVPSFFWVPVLYAVSETWQHQTADGFEIFNLIRKAKVRLGFLMGSFQFSAASYSFWFTFIFNYISHSLVMAWINRIWILPGWAVSSGLE